MDTKTAGKKGAEKRWSETPTKVKAIEKILKDYGGRASWKYIYYPVEKTTEWKAGIRGVV